MTKDQFRAKFSGGHIGDVLDYKKRLNDIADFIYDYSLKFKGTANAATIAALTDMTNLDTYIIGTGGNLNDGNDAITTATGDIVYYNATTELWVFLHDLS